SVLTKQFQHNMVGYALTASKIILSLTWGTLQNRSGQRSKLYHLDGDIRPPYNEGASKGDNIKGGRQDDRLSRDPQAK
ncbi:MAG: hypothetical protein IJ091_04715, partial [Oscillospiraceae bacterium]|nr:hypothetical protein [Oscillospiraceae bacterium]